MFHLTSFSYVTKAWILNFDSIESNFKQFNPNNLTKAQETKHGKALRRTKLIFALMFLK